MARTPNAMAAAFSSLERLPGEDVDVRVDVAKIFDRPDLWLQSPNAHIGGMTPEDAIRNGHENAVRNLLRQIIYIGMS